MTGIIIEADKNAAFLLYVHDAGEEYYFHYDAWPDIPFVHHPKSWESTTIIGIKKEVEIGNEKCRDESYDYFGAFPLQDR